MTTKNTDTIAPTLISAIPKAKGTAVKVNQNVTLQFSESIKVGSGGIVISSGKDIRTIAMTDPQVTISDKTLTINPISDLLSGSRYTLKLANTAITDLTGNKFKGTTFTFDTADILAPVLSKTLPVNGSKLVAVSSNVVLTFNEKITLGTGNIVLSHGGIEQLIPVTDTKQVKISGTTLTLNPKLNFDFGSAYTVKLDAGAVKDVAGNTFAGNGDGFKFYTKLKVGTDKIAPTLTAFTPIDKATSVAVDANLTLTFSETISAGVGSIIISNGKDDTRAISIADKTQITIVGKVLTINPKAALFAGSDYNVTIAKGVITDNAGNPFAGISTAVVFSTLAVEKPAVLVLTSGKAIDGYLSGSDVFADENGDGIQNANEATAKTDPSGNFTLANAKGTINISGGTDLSTGKAFQGALKAPEGSAVVTPFTTVQQGFIEAGQTPAQAEKSVATAFGFDADKVDLTKYDPIAELVKAVASGATDSVATQMMASSAQIANFFVTAGQVLQGAAGGSDNISTKNVGDALLKSLVSSIQSDVKTGDGKINLADASLLKAVIIDGAKEVNTFVAKVAKETGTAAPKFDATVFADKIDKLADTVTAVMKTAADNITAAVTKGGDAITLLSNMDKVSAFTQNDAGKSLSDAVKTLDPKNATSLASVLKAQTDSFTGDAATKSITSKVVETLKAVGDVIKADKATTDAATKVISDAAAAKATADKATADAATKANADKATADAATKANADKATADAATKATADKAIADAATKANADTAAAKIISDKAAADALVSNVTISGNGSSATTSVADVFTVLAGNYSYTINTALTAGFNAGDKLNFFPDAVLNVANDTNQTDGNQTLTATNPVTNATVTLNLTGLTPTQDAAIFNVPSLNTAFGVTNLVNYVGTATPVVDTFTINSGNYNLTIAGFTVGDKLNIFKGAVLNLVNDTIQTDGIQVFTATDSINNTTATITLTGLTAAQDAALYNITSFDTVFGTNTLILNNTGSDNGVYSITAGNSHSIAGFVSGNKLSFFSNAILNVINDMSQSDGVQELTATDPVSGAVATITLTGLTSTQDVNLFNIPSFSTVFGVGTIA